MLRTIGSMTSLLFLMVGCGGGGAVGGSIGGGGTGGAMSAPSGLQYGGNTVGDEGAPYGPLQPTVTGAVSGYSVSPALPAGLSLNPSTGVITGTPLTASPETTYTITASNAAGAATITLNLVVLVPPTALTYAGPATGTVGAALTPLVPALTGNADAFTVFPPLPAGLILDPATGIVSGTPTSARLPLTYVLTASNVGGAFTTSELLLTVDPPPAGTAVTGVFRSDTVIGLGYVSGAHSGLTDNSGAFTYEEGQGITFSVGAVTIGALLTAKTLATPVDLVSQGTSTSTRVLNVVRFLMMLDQDGNANNGIQISPAVTAAAASWAPVDFNTSDLPTTLGPIIQQASTADGVSHVLPDAPTAQAHLRSAFYCMRSGSYYGTFGAGRLAGFGRGDFTASVFPDGSMHSLAYTSDTLPGFDVQTNDAVSPLLDGTFAQSAASPSVSLQGSFADATYLSGTFVSPFTALGDFQAVGNASVTTTYKFTGSYTWTPNDPTQGSPSSGPVNLVMDDSNQVSGSAIGTLAGTVSGNTFNGSVKYRLAGDLHAVPFPVSGTYSNTASGVTLDGQYSTPESVVTFSTVGCRAN